MADGTKETAIKKAKAAAGKSSALKTGGFSKLVTPSPQLAAIVGDKPLPRSQIVSLMWAYIKEHNLQDATDRRQINADAKLQPIFGKKQASMFELSKFIAVHVK
jgi:upstream activation factor subunit UAF30